MILRIDEYLMTKLLLGIMDWIMEDKWDIKKVLEVEGNTHKVGVQANSESRSLTLSPTQSLGPPSFKLAYKKRPTSDLGDLHMHGKLRR
jgi:hypothetical protein